MSARMMTGGPDAAEFTEAGALPQILGNKKRSGHCLSVSPGHARSRGQPPRRGAHVCLIDGATYRDIRVVIMVTECAKAMITVAA